MYIGIASNNQQQNLSFGYDFTYDYKAAYNTGGISRSGEHTHDITGNTSSAGAHTHTLNGAVGAVSGVTTGTSGNLPPYYSLYFIIKYKKSANNSSTVHNLKVYRYIK